MAARPNKYHYHQRWIGGSRSDEGENYGSWRAVQHRVSSARWSVWTPVAQLGRPLRWYLAKNSTTYDVTGPRLNFIRCTPKQSAAPHPVWLPHLIVPLGPRSQQNQDMLSSVGWESFHGT